ncbi:hypothetical protein C8J57DRAFT_1244952 [Mycena rebaudengoi]|nr:hypothetical protein C8J57DRAFT_1244952 [Mycena rebaudengoi]
MLMFGISGPRRKETLITDTTFLPPSLRIGDVTLRHEALAVNDLRKAKDNHLQRDGPPRPVVIDCHPVGIGLSGLLKDELDKVEKETGKSIPDPTYHWAVMVGDYYHELNPKGISGGVAFMHIQNVRSIWLMASKSQANQSQFNS